MDVVSYALRSSAAAVAHACAVVASSAQRHAQLVAAEVIASNAEHLEYVRSTTVGLAPARRKSVNVIRSLVHGKQAAGDAGAVPPGSAAYSSPHRQSAQQRRACACAVRLAEIRWHMERSRALRHEIATRTLEAHRALVHDAFASLMVCLDELYGETMDAFVTAVLIIDKGAPPAPAPAPASASAAPAGGMKAMIPPRSEVESLKGVERRLFKAIRAIRLPPGEGTVVGSIGAGRRSQQSVDDAVEVCAECIGIVNGRLTAIFAGAADADRAGEDHGAATFRSALRHIGDDALQGFLTRMLVRIAGAIVDAATSDGPNEEDADADGAAPESAAGGRRSFSLRRRGSSSGVVVNTGRIEVASSTLDEFEKLVRTFAADDAPVREVDELRGALVAAAAAAGS